MYWPRFFEEKHPLWAAQTLLLMGASKELMTDTFMDRGTMDQKTGLPSAAGSVSLTCQEGFLCSQF